LIRPFPSSRGPTCRFIAALLFLAGAACVSAQAVAAQDDSAQADQGLSARPQNTLGLPLRIGIAFLEVNAVNVATNLFDRVYYAGQDWMLSTPATAWSNLVSQWHWDQDPFPVNEIGHPIMGSFYYIASRSNGLDFWESSLGTLYGSVAWKVFGETNDPNNNDVITTTIGGVVLGEMLYRLYVQAEREGSLLRFAFGSLDEANKAVFGRGSWEDETRGEASLAVRMGFGGSYLDLAPTRVVASGPGGAGAEMEESLTYGTPYRENAAPFDFFEQRMYVDLSSSLQEVAFFSDGTLYSRPVIDDGADRLAVGSSIHYDFMDGSLIEFSSNALGLSVIGEHDAPGGFRLSGEIHANFNVLATSENEYLLEINGPQGSSEGRDYDFAWGGGLKLRLGVEQARLGELHVDYAFYDLNSIPASNNDLAWFEDAQLDFLDVSYEHALVPHWALGVDYKLYHKDADYQSRASIHESIRQLSLFIEFR
jgi:hypothetical protein